MTSQPALSFLFPLHLQTALRGLFIGRRRIVLQKAPEHPLPVEPGSTPGGLLHKQALSIAICMQALEYKEHNQ